MPDQPLILAGSSRRALRAFPELPRRLAGFQLRRVQQGLDPHDWKPMPTVGPGVRDHAFEKKSQKTTLHDLETGRERFRAIGKLRHEHGKAKRR